MFAKIIRTGSFLAALCLVLAGPGNITPARATQPASEQPRTGLLKTGDKIDVSVEGEKDLSGLYTINKAGKIKMPLIGEIFVAGKTPHEATILITQKLQDGYLTHPDVAIGEKAAEQKPQSKNPRAGKPDQPGAHPAPAVKDGKPLLAGMRPEKLRKHKHIPLMALKGMKRIYIVGAVNKPGYYLLPPDAGHILNIIALAGGYTDKANEQEFEIVRAIDNVYYRRRAKTGALDYHDGDIVIIGER